MNSFKNRFILEDQQDIANRHLETIKRVFDTVSRVSYDGNGNTYIDGTLEGKGKRKEPYIISAGNAQLASVIAKTISKEYKLKEPKMVPVNESDELLENNLTEAKLKPSDFKKGDKVKWAGTFGSREQDEEGTIIGFKDHEDYKNGYLIIKGKDGKEYKIIFSSVSLNESDDKNEKMFGMSKEELDNMIDDARSKKFLVMGILSDIQEVISDKKIQQKLNVAKYIIDKNMK